MSWIMVNGALYTAREGHPLHPVESAYGLGLIAIISLLMIFDNGKGMILASRVYIPVYLLFGGMVILNLYHQSPPSDSLSTPTIPYNLSDSQRVYFYGVHVSTLILFFNGFTYLAPVRYKSLHNAVYALTMVSVWAVIKFTLLASYVVYSSNGNQAIPTKVPSFINSALRRL